MVILALLGPLSGQAAANPVEIQDLVAQVNADSMMLTVERLVAFETRFMGSDSNRAAGDWIGTRLGEMGYTATYDSFQVDVNRVVLGRRFTLSGLTQVNVMAAHRGIQTPEKKIVLGAHFDSISLDRDQDHQGFAPGADDNATGVAAVLEIARVLKDVQTSMTIEFALFGAEELGLVGSEAAAAAAQQNGEEIVLMMGLDVLGTRSTVFPDAFTLDTTSRGFELAEQISDAADTFTDLFTRDGSSNSRIMLTSSGCRCSDHQSYLDHGFPAIGVFQFFTNPAPHINMSTDTSDQVDIGFVAGITGAILAGTLEIAGFPVVSPDFDGSGIVDFTDFLQFADAFGSDPVSPEEAVFDLDSDGAVGFSDFLIFAANFGRTF